MAHAHHRRTKVTYNTPGEAHELTFSCYKRLPFLDRFHCYARLAEAINRARAKYEFELWAYVFMPEHVHLLVWPRKPGYSMETIAKAIKQSVARRVITELKTQRSPQLSQLETGSRRPPYRFWMRGSGYDRNVTELGTLDNVVKYIHANPLRRELVSFEDEWKWSSAREWEEPGAGPLSIDRDSFPVLRG